MDKRNKLKCIAAGVITGFINGFFGSGGGIIAVCFMTRFLDMEQKDSQATAISLILPLALVSSFFYYTNLDFNIDGIWLIIAGGVAGSLTGAFILGKFNNTILKKIFAIFIIFSAGRMIIG